MREIYDTYDSMTLTHESCLRRPMPLAYSGTDTETRCHVTVMSLSCQCHVSVVCSVMKCQYLGLRPGEREVS